MNMLSRALLSAAVALTFALTVAVAAAPQSAVARDADAILNDIKNIERPKFDPAKREDDAYVKEYIAAQNKSERQEAALILELHEKFPDHEKVPTLLPRRWAILMHDQETEDVALKEMAAIIENSPDSKLAGEARYIKTQNVAQKHLFGEDKDVEKASAVIEEFIAATPTDERGARLLGMLADAYDDGSEQQVAAYERILKAYPNSGSAKYAKGKIRQATSVGKPFELSFQDAITGETVDLSALRGKVVVVDFWATWCGPCVAEMPHMKELYQQYREKGVEFIGISLDQPEDKGGLEKLKKFVAEKEIAWPQYYQGKGWESEFSTGWGINAIPALFILDKKGNLRSTSARGKLEELIPELLAE
jgi:thiol-disulfide isomerase/thioredoxin